MGIKITTGARHAHTGAGEERSICGIVRASHAGHTCRLVCGGIFTLGTKTTVRYVGGPLCQDKFSNGTIFAHLVFGSGRSFVVVPLAANTKKTFSDASALRIGTAYSTRKALGDGRMCIFVSPGIC